MPFLIIFQASGIITLTKFVLNPVSQKENFVNRIHWVLTGVIIVYFSFLQFGKYKNLDANSGNPYELAREYLKNNSGPNDLIIGIGSKSIGIRETTGNFYFKNLIRSKIKKIYQSKKIKNIYGLIKYEPKTGLPLKRYFSTYQDKSEEFLKKEYFNSVALFENFGVLGEKLYIFRTSVKEQQSYNFKKQNLSLVGFFGEDRSKCKIKGSSDGFFLYCGESKIACSKRILNLPLETEADNYIVGIFKHINKFPTGGKSVAFLNSAISLEDGFRFNDKDFKENLFFANFLTDNLENMDPFKRHISQTSVQLQKISKNKSLLLCLTGDLFQGEALIKDVTFLNLKLFRQTKIN